MKISTIFWDNDGVLVNTEELYFEATKEILATIGFELNPSRYHELFLASGRGMSVLADERGMSFGEIEKLRSRRNDIYAEFLRSRPLIVPGAKEVLQELSQHFRMAIVTSSRRVHFDLIHQRTGFLPYFEFVLAEGDYAEAKPHPDPYLTALRRSGAHPGNCLVIEDSPRGLAAARAAGVACWVIPGRFAKEGDFTGAEKVLGHLGQIPDLLHQHMKYQN